MKASKQKVIVLALVVCLLATLSMGTLAWFTDDDYVTNDFMIAGSENKDPDDVFSVDVWEHDSVDDVYGEDNIQDGIEYPNILPGDNLYKEVNVENTGSYPQYIRVTVTVSDASIWQEIFKEPFVSLNKIATDLNDEFAVWSTTYDETSDSLIYVLHYDNILAVDEVVTLFTNVAIPEELDRLQAAQMAGGFQINVVADAVQTENVGDNAVEAFETVGMGLPEGNTIIISNTTLNDTDNFYNVTGNTIMENVVINGMGIQNNGNELVMTKVDMELTGAYANILRGDSVTVYDEVNILAHGGGVNAQAGAQVEFNAGEVVLDSTQTSQRHIFYAAGEGTKVVVNDGTFSFEAYRQRSYACAQYGAVIEIYGGTFGVAPNHPRWTYPIYVTDGGKVIIYGGTFGFDPSEWVASGYVAVPNGNTWTVEAQ